MKSILTIGILALSLLKAAGSHGGGHHENMGHWDAPESAKEVKNPVSKSKDSINRGAVLFQANCASCHGINADGKGTLGKNFKIRPTDLVSMSKNHVDGDFFWKIQTGKGDMPSWKNTFSENQTWDLVNYIKSLGDDSNHGH